MNKPTTIREQIIESLVEGKLKTELADQILQVIAERLPKEKEKTFIGKKADTNIEFTHYIGIVDGWNECLTEVKSLLQEKTK